MQEPGSRRPFSEQRAPVWATLGAVGVLLVGLVAIPGCLNPRPEEDPSALELADPEADTAAPEDGFAPSADAPVRETCDDNPLLGGCAAPSPAPNAGGVEPSADADAPADAPDAGGSSVYDAGAADASAADAGAPATASSPLLD